MVACSLPAGCSSCSVCGLCKGGREGNRRAKGILLCLVGSQFQLVVLLVSSAANNTRRKCPSLLLLLRSQRVCYAHSWAAGLHPPPHPLPSCSVSPCVLWGVTHRFLAPFPCAPRWALCLGWADLAVPAVPNASAATALVLTPQLTTWLLYIYFFLIPPYFLSHSPKGVGSGRCLSPPRAPAGHHPEMHTAQEGCLCPAPHSATILPSFPAGSRQYLQLGVCCGIPRLYSALCRCSYRICSLLRGREENFS